MECLANLKPQTLLTGNVSKAKRGAAQIVCDSFNNKHRVTAVSHNMPYVIQGQQVVFYVVDGGATLLYALNTIDNHRPQKSFVHTNSNTIKLEHGATKIEADSSGNISIRVNEHHLTIGQQGELIAQANQIKLHAKECLVLECLKGDIQFEIRKENQSDSQDERNIQRAFSCATTLSDNKDTVPSSLLS